MFGEPVNYLITVSAPPKYFLFKNSFKYNILQGHNMIKKWYKGILI